MWTSLWLGVALAAKPATTDLAALKADVARWDKMIEADGTYQFNWTDDELKLLAAGQFVKRRERLEGADRAMGAIWTSAKIDPLWVAVQDEAHAVLIKGLTEERMPGSTFQHKLLFQRVDLPWPFADRQWMIEVVNNTVLFEKSGGKCWERTWSLIPLRGAQAEEENAVWVTTNDGGWMVAEAGGGTLVAFHVRTIMGGNVPEDAATKYYMTTVGGMLREIVARSLEMPEHYVGGHSPILYPDGNPIATFDAPDLEAPISQ